MPGSKRRTDPDKLQEWIDENYPGAQIIPRTDKNRYCTVYYPENGYIICRGTSNGDVLEKMTAPAPNKFVPDYKNPKMIVDVMPTVDLKSRVENLVNYMLAARQELAAITKSDPRFVYHRDESVSIKTGDTIRKKK